MRRKLVKQGNTTYTVSLPKDWVERLNLEQGNDIDIEELGDNLTISSPKNKQKNNPIHFSSIPEKLAHEIIVSSYKAGIREIDIEGINKSKIDSALKNTIGLEIISSKGNKISIIDLGAFDEQNIEKAENQIYWRILYMIERVLANAKISEIEDIDLEINKLSFYIQRNLASRYSSNYKNFIVFEKISLLESLGDFIKLFVNHSKLDNRSIKFIKEVSSLLESLRGIKSKEEYIEIYEKLAKIKKNLEKNDFSSLLILKTLKQIIDSSMTLVLDKFKDVS
jgi:phosphate uptake regulator